MVQLVLTLRNESARRKRFSVNPGEFFPFFQDFGFEVTVKSSIVIPGKGQLDLLVYGNWHTPDGSETVYPQAQRVRHIRIKYSWPPAYLSAAVRDFCAKSRQRFNELFEQQEREILVIKYVPAIRLNDVLRTGALFATNSPGYTWGDAVYVSPLDTPFSTMMYGDVGIIGSYHPGTVYDGRDPYGIFLYQQWIQTQFRWFDLLTTTIHGDVANRFLRNRFRSVFGIDCVFFKPDQFAASYVRRADCWLAVTNWVQSGTGARVAGGPSSVIRDLELSVVVSERFDGTRSKFFYNPLLGDVLRKRNTTAFPLKLASVNYGTALRNAYANRNSTPKPAVFVTHEQP